MTSPATQEPCPKCKDQGVVVDAAGRIIPCDCIWGTSPAPPSQRAELLTQEQLGAAIFNAYRPVTAKVDHGATIDKLVGHITALTQRVAELTSDRDAKTKRMWELGHECDRLQSALTAITVERDALRRAIAEPAPDVQEAVLRRLGLLNARDQLTAAQQRIADLEAQCARVQRDAERYAWLRHTAEKDDHDSVSASVTLFSADDGVIYEDGFGEDTLDAAIDAAMAAKADDWLTKEARQIGLHSPACASVRFGQNECDCGAKP